MSATPGSAKAAIAPVHGTAKLKVKRSPSALTQELLGECATRMLNEGFGYRESQELFRLFLLGTALRLTKGVKKHAAARLGISRDHVRDYYERGKELL